MTSIPPTSALTHKSLSPAAERRVEELGGDWEEPACVRGKMEERLMKLRSGGEGMWNPSLTVHYSGVVASS